MIYCLKTNKQTRQTQVLKKLRKLLKITNHFGLALKSNGRNLIFQIALL